LTLPLFFAFAACEDDENIFDIADVVGDFAADSALVNSVFEVIENGDTIDVLEEGGEIELSLNADGTATGFLFAPGLGPNGTDIEEDLAGVWNFVDGRIRVDLTPDTFLDDLEFEFTGGRLVADETINGTRFRIVLVRV